MNKSTILNNLIPILRERTRGLNVHNKNASKLVDDADAHATGLRRQAVILESLIKDTKNFSDDAVRAATVYSNIVQAILEAYKAARSANNTASSTNMKVQTQNYAYRQ